MLPDEYAVQWIDDDVLEIDVGTITAEVEVTDVDETVPEGDESDVSNRMMHLVLLTGLCAVTAEDAC